MDDLISAMFSMASVFVLVAIVMIVFRKRNIKREIGNATLIFNKAIYSIFFLLLTVALLYGTTNLNMMLDKFEDLTHVVSDQTFLKVYETPDDFLIHLGYPVLFYMVIYFVVFGIVLSLLYVNIHNLVMYIKELNKRIKDKPYGRLKIALERDRGFDFKEKKDILIQAFYEFQNSNSNEEIFYDDLKYISLALLERGYDVEAKVVLNNAIKQKENKVIKGNKLSWFDWKGKFLFLLEKRKGIKVKVN